MDYINRIKNIFIKNKFSCVALLFSMLFTIGSIMYVYINQCEECEVCKLCEVCEVCKEETENIEMIEKEKKVKVDVKGSVKKPGVYELPELSTVSDAIALAGGLTSNGVTTNINLSKKIKDEMVIYVFSKSELEKKEIVEATVCEVPKCECEQIVIKPEDYTINTTETVSSKDEETPTQMQTSDEKISINTDSIDELMQLDGIGESKAKTIIEYRKEHGNFTNIEDIKNVSGIGDKAYEKIKDNIKI